MPGSALLLQNWVYLPVQWQCLLCRTITQPYLYWQKLGGDWHARVCHHSLPPLPSLKFFSGSFIGHPYPPDLTVAHAAHLANSNLKPHTSPTPPSSHIQADPDTWPLGMLYGGVSCYIWYRLVLWWLHELSKRIFRKKFAKNLTIFVKVDLLRGDWLLSQL